MIFDDKQNIVGTSLTAKVLKIASEHPETRSHLIPLIKQHVAAFSLNPSLLKKHMGLTPADADDAYIETSGSNKGLFRLWWD